MEALSQPPGQPGKAYKLGSLCGEIIYIPCSKSATRLLVTGKESEGAFAVVSSGGSGGYPIGFHYHRQAHDVFLCIKGRMNVWAGDVCRTMEPGDFASVPPTVVHQYQILGDHNEFLGLIIPGGWEEFFRSIGDPYDGPMWPLEDARGIEVLLSRLKDAVDKHDYVPMPDLPHFGPQPWDDDTNCSLPGTLTPYFLRAGRGPRYRIGGLITTPLITTDESNHAFSVGSVEGSSSHDHNPVSKGVTFARSHHCFYVVDGFLELVVDGSTIQLGPTETLYIPRGTTFALRFNSRYVKTYIFANGGGLLEALCKVGTPYRGPMIPEKDELVDLEHFQKLGLGQYDLKI